VSLTYEARFASIERYIVAAHGSPRPLTAQEMLVIDGFAQAVLFEVEDVWPVETSLSRDSFDYTIEDGGYGSDDPVGFTITNPVWYVQFVHRTGEGPTPLWTWLLPQVIQSAAPPWLAKLRLAIDVTEATIKRGNPLYKIIATGAQRFSIGVQ